MIDFKKYMIDFYSNPRYKYYLLVPLFLFILTFYLAAGIGMGMDLRGGTLVTAEFSPAPPIHELESALEARFGVDTEARQTTTGDIYIIELDIIPGIYEASILIAKGDNESLEKARTILLEMDPGIPANETVEQMYAQAKVNYRDDLHDFLLSQGMVEDSFSLNEIGPALSDLFWKQAQDAFIIAFIAMSVIVFFVYRMVVPSFVVITAVVFDIVFALGLMSLFGIKLSLATMAGILMIIGYSVDNDVLLVNRALRKRGTLSERIASAMSTGLMTESCTLTALVILYGVSMFAQIQTLMVISATLLFGLIGDIFSTWFSDAVIIKWYFEVKGH